MTPGPRIVAIADVHVGNHGRFGGELIRGLNRRCWAVLESLRQACKVAAEEDAVLFVGGDLYDRHDPPAGMVEAVMEVLCYAGRVVVVCGNHDRAGPGHHALGPLRYLRNVQVITQASLLRDVNGWDVLCAPFQAGQGRDWLLPLLLGLEGPGVRPRALVTHLGLRTAGTPWFLRDAADAIDAHVLADACRSAGVELALLGNWHAPLDVTLAGVELRQCGALVPTGWDDPGPGYGRVVGPGGWTGPQIPGPRFLDWGKHELDTHPSAGQYVRAGVALEEEAAVRAELERLRVSGAVAGYEVLVRRAETTAPQPSSARSRAEALRARVESTEVEAPGQREAVLDWCTRELRVG